MERKFKVFDNVVINTEINGIQKGTKGVVVHKYSDYVLEVEFFNNANRTLGVELVNENQLEFRK